MTELVTLGETMALLSAPVPGPLRHMTSLGLSIAGSESNVAIAVRRLGSPAAWIGRVGADELGELILAVLRREDVDVGSAVRDTEAQTAIMFKERRHNVSRVSYYRKGYAGSRLCPSDVDEHAVSSARVLHITGITLGLSPSARAAAYAAVEMAKASDVLVSFDLNYRSALWAPSDAARELADMARRADLLFAGEDELAMLGDDEAAALKRLMPGGGRTIVVKRGERGASAFDDDGQLDEPAVPVDVVDPVGAGDAFVGGYLYGVLNESDQSQRLKLGCASGACVVSSFGDWEALPTLEDLPYLGSGAGTTLR